MKRFTKRFGEAGKYKNIWGPENENGGALHTGGFVGRERRHSVQHGDK